MMKIAQGAGAALKAAATVAVISVSLLSGAHAQGTASNPAGKKQAAKTAKARDAQSVLFLTPGGLYTDADIKANGRKTVAQKYPDFMAQHDAKPKPGDRVCPIVAAAKMAGVWGQHGLRADHPTWGRIEGPSPAVEEFAACFNLCAEEVGTSAALEVVIESLAGQATQRASASSSR